MSEETRTGRAPARPTARRTVHSPSPAASRSPELDDTLEPTDDLTEVSVPDPPPSALRVALNRPISLADVRAVQAEQSALASEATHVGPPTAGPPSRP